MTKPLESGETVAPSPLDLNRKILLKHRKLPEGDSEEGAVAAAGAGLSQAAEEGILTACFQFRKAAKSFVIAFSDS